MKKIFIIAGEKSGDIYGGMLAEELQKLYGEKIKIYSCGGNSLKKNSEQIINLLDHSVSGLVEVIGSLGKLFKVFDQVISEIEKIKPDLIIPIDFPDFNLRLAKKINKKYKLFYYISPQLWAWRKGRINLVKKYIHKMIVIFKFEEEFYKEHGVNALYFGHPLLDIIPKENYETKKIISLLPGSRRNEIKLNLPVMLEAKKILEQKLKGYSFCIIKADNIQKEFYNKFTNDIEIKNHSYQAIAESEFIIASSGTATIEIAILGVPYIIMYKLKILSWHLLKMLVKLDFVGMVNIVSKRKIVDEFLQDEANAKNLAEKTIYYLENKDIYSSLKENLETVKEKLTPYESSLKFAQYIGKDIGL